MKKMLKYASLSAIAFVGAVSFSACSSSDDMTESPNNPNYNPETNKVKTEFVINVTQPGERTRMAADNAGAGTFQGLDNMQLICFTNTPGTDNDFGADDKLTLTPYTGPSVSGDNTTNSSKVYTMYIPVNTTNFLFYATTYGTVGNNDKFTYGSLQNNLSSVTTTTVVTSPSASTDITFNLEPIASTPETVTAPQTTLLGVLNGIAGASYDKGTESTEDDITWASTGSMPTPATQWVALKNAFNQFTNQASGSDVRQGSSAAILSMVVDLFGAVNDVYTNESNADAKGVAKAILDKIMTYFNVTLSGTTYTWESPAYKSDYNVDFPESVNLPACAAVLVYNGTNGFTYVNGGTMGAATVSTAYNKFTYPSELTYYCNSGLWQSTTNKDISDYPITSSTWLSYGWNSNGWNNNAVSAATRAVAMKDNITYGAAQLVSNVQLGANVGDDETHALEDNAYAVTNHVEPANKKFYGSGDNAITLKVHGLLIGGQPDAARYDYLPQGGNISNVVYDKFSPNGTEVTSTAWATPNYTLVLDNYATGETQATVNVALEMTATKDFYGASGKIKAGQKFYLIGSLDPTSFAANAIDWSKHVSFKSTDTGYNVNRVFIRDAKTTATFTLAANCLQKAYSTIPDLRSTQMLFGVSVDLAWKAGLTFDVNIGE
ncbi:MAG: hypothetical protein J6E43_03030 [Prevotella sp.]|nr:hypothetical protein [Prevotella sp.]